MKIKDIPSIDRPREKLLRYGPERLSIIELLAVILGTGVKGANVIELADKLLKNIHEEGLVSASFEELEALMGIGSVKASILIASFELGKRLLKEKQSILLLAPKDVWLQLQDVREQRREHFVVFYLDIRNQIIKRDIISIGTLNASLVHPREVFEAAIKDGAAQLILSHNHPSGIVEPSDEDLGLTKRLCVAGKILGIEIIDHIIVSKYTYFSFKEHKYM